MKDGDMYQYSADKNKLLLISLSLASASELGDEPSLEDIFNIH